MVSFENLYSIKRTLKGKKAIEFIKLDMMKVYDKGWMEILWLYAHSTGVQNEIGGYCFELCDLYLLLIIHYGVILDSFKQSMWLRQGDPLSLYLFINCAKDLSG